MLSKEVKCNVAFLWQAQYLVRVRSSWIVTFFLAGVVFGDLVKLQCHFSWLVQSQEKLQ